MHKITQQKIHIKQFGKNMLQAWHVYSNDSNNAYVSVMLNVLDWVDSVI